MLPDILRYDRTKPPFYPNGRRPIEDIYSYRFAWLTYGKVPPQGLKPHPDLLTDFPYLGPPNPYPPHSGRAAPHVDNLGAVTRDHGTGYPGPAPRCLPGATGRRGDHA